MSLPYVKSLYDSILFCGKTLLARERVKDAFDDNKATGVLDAKYAEGARDKEFLAKYVESLISMYSPDASKVAAELYGQLTDEEKVSADYWFIFNNPDLARSRL